MQDFTMRQMSAGGIIDRTFRLYRNHFTPMILLSLVIGGGANLVIGVIEELTTSSFVAPVNSALVALQGGGFPATGGFLSYFLRILQGLLILPLVNGGITFITLAISHGEIHRGGGYLSRIRPVYGKLVGTSFCIGLMMGGCFVAIFLVALIMAFISPVLAVLMAFLALVACGLLLYPVVLLAYPVAIQENRYGFSWVGRTFTLFFQRFGKSLGVIWLSTLIVSVLGGVIGLLPALLPSLVGTIASVLVQGVLQPILIIATALLYLDIRISAEAYDLELRLGAMGDRQNPGGNGYHG